MNKKYITVDQISIAYLERNEHAGKTIFFIHGNSISSKSWLPQLEGPFLRNYRMIAIDLPAHGDSDPLTDGDYSLPRLGALVAQTVKALAGGQPFIIAGLSLGTNLIAEAIGYGLEPAGVVLASCCITGKNITLDKIAASGTNVFVVFTDEASVEDVSIYAYEALNGNSTAQRNDFINDYMNVKDNFRSRLYKSIEDVDYNDEIALINSTGLPVLVIFGEEDPLINTYYLYQKLDNLWGYKIFNFEDASHMVNIDAVEMFNSHVASYADERLRA